MRHELYLQRLANTRRVMLSLDVPVMLSRDPFNVRYVTGASNMTVFNLCVPARYLLVFAEGSTILFDDGPGRPEQRELYRRAHEQLLHNVSLIGPGVAFEDVARNAWSVPEEHWASRYYCIGHGLGMIGEYPNLRREAGGSVAQDTLAG